MLSQDQINFFKSYKEHLGKASKIINAEDYQTNDPELLDIAEDAVYIGKQALSYLLMAERQHWFKNDLAHHIDSLVADGIKKQSEIITELRKIYIGYGFNEKEANAYMAYLEQKKTDSSANESVQ